MIYLPKNIRKPYSPWKHQKSFGFLVFSGGIRLWCFFRCYQAAQSFLMLSRNIERDQWPVMGWCVLILVIVFILLLIFIFFVCLFCFCLLYVCSIFIFFIFVNLRLFFEKKLNIIKKNRRLNRKVSWFGDFCNLDLTQTAKI